MFWAFVISLGLAALALSGWTLCELDLRDTLRALEDAEHDRDVAIGWAETQLVHDVVVHPTLHVVDGGEA